MEISEQQLAQWRAYADNWTNSVRPSVQKAILLGEIARDFQEWCDAHSIMFPTVFSSADNEKLIKLADVYNRIDRSNMKVENGTYGLKFTGGKMDIIAPIGMNPEEYQGDQVTGFGIGPLIWIAVIGVVVIGGILATSYLVKQFANKTGKDTEKKIVESAKEISEMSPEMQAALAKLLEANRERLQEAGLLDQLLGGGSGAVIAGAIAIGIVIYAYTRRG